MFSHFIDVRFYGRDPDVSLVAAAHRCVARLEQQQLSVHRAAIAIESSGRRQTSVTLSLTLSDGQLSVAATHHADPYVAVADAFRQAERRLAGTRHHRELAFAS